MTQHYRLLVALANLLLLGAIGWVGFRVFVGGPGESIPKVQPTQYQIQSEGQARNGVQQHQIVWREIDRAAPPPAPVQPVAPVPDRPSTPTDLSSIYELVMCSFDPDSPELSSCVLRDRRGAADGPQRMVGVGDNLDGYKVLEIVVSGDADNRVAEVTVDDRGKPSKITLRRITQ